MKRHISTSSKAGDVPGKKIIHIDARIIATALLSRLSASERKQIF